MSLSCWFRRHSMQRHNWRMCMPKWRSMFCFIKREWNHFLWMFLSCWLRRNSMSVCYDYIPVVSKCRLPKWRLLYNLFNMFMPYWFHWWLILFKSFVKSFTFNFFINSISIFKGNFCELSNGIPVIVTRPPGITTTVAPVTQNPFTLNVCAPGICQNG